MIYKYTDATSTVVHVIDANGISRSSMLASALPEGTEIQPADVYVPPIPSVVSMEQARLALFDIGLLDQVESEMAKKDKKANITWNFATVVKRDSPLVQDVKTVLGLTETDLDNLFLLASTL